MLSGFSTNFHTFTHPIVVFPVSACQSRTGIHPCILKSFNVTPQPVRDCVWFILNTNPVSFTPRNPHFKTCHTSRCFSRLSHRLSAIVTFNYFFGASHHQSAFLGHSRSLYPFSDWLIQPGQESKFSSLKWDAEHIWQGSQQDFQFCCYRKKKRFIHMFSSCVCCSEYLQFLKVNGYPEWSV